ncbi:hypothetical protein FAIPA1_540006 [Frankia sp. AiPs1]
MVDVLLREVRDGVALLTLNRTTVHVLRHNGFTPRALAAAEAPPRTSDPGRRPARPSPA